MERRWDLIGAPSSAGAHTPGVELAPAALRAAGLADVVRRSTSIEDRGDVAGSRWVPDPDRPRAQNAAEVARVARDVAAAVTRSARAGRTPLVLGGDCTVTIGLVAGHTATGVAPALVYVDGGPDLYTPATRVNGNLDAMGLAHMLALPGHEPQVAGPGAPLLTADRVVVLGDSLPPGDHERELVDELGLTYVPADEVHADAEGAARGALAVVEEAAPAFLVHFDVDVLRFVEMPLADVPEPLGLSLSEACTVLSTLVASPRFAGMTVTEVNPAHLPDDRTLPRFTRALAEAIGLA